MKVSKGILFGSLLAALSTSPLLLASRPAQAESTTFDVEPRKGHSVLTTGWTNYVTLTGSTSTWSTVTAYFWAPDGSTNIVVYSQGPNDLDPPAYAYTGAGTWTWFHESSIQQKFTATGTYACFCIDYGTGPGGPWDLAVQVNVIVS